MIRWLKSIFRKKTQSRYVHDKNAPSRKFEIYILRYFVNSGEFDLLKKPHEHLEGLKSEDDNLPDCKFRDKRSGKQFWVECKWRIDWKEFNGKKASFFKKGNIDFYRKIQRQTKYKVFIALGIGKSELYGETEDMLYPRALYFFPLDYFNKETGDYYYVPQSFLHQRKRMHLFKYKKPKFFADTNELK